MGCDYGTRYNTVYSLLFQSTHPSGVRHDISKSECSTCNFNPRTPVGCDHQRNSARPSGQDFNPRTPVGCDGGECGLMTHPEPFQSTHPSGVRPGYTTGEHHLSQDFNPRTPVGCDHVAITVGGETICISIHAPQWGATTRPDLISSDHSYFNPRTPVGCD